MRIIRECSCALMDSLDHTTDMRSIKTDWYYLTGGALGVLITVTVMLAMSNSSPAIAVSVILVSQLLVAAGIDFLGIFGTDKAPFGLNKILGLIILTVGIVIFKIK